MRAIGESRGRVFFLSDNNTKSEVWAECLKAAYTQIMATLRMHRGPFIARITRSGSLWGVKELTKVGNEKRKKRKTNPLSAEVRGSNLGRAEGQAGAESKKPEEPQETS